MFCKWFGILLEDMKPIGIQRKYFPRRIFIWAPFLDSTESSIFLQKPGLMTQFEFHAVLILRACRPPIPLLTGQELYTASRKSCGKKVLLGIFHRGAQKSQIWPNMAKNSRFKVTNMAKTINKIHFWTNSRVKMYN